MPRVDRRPHKQWVLATAALVLTVVATAFSIVGCRFGESGAVRGKASSESWTLCLYLCGSNLESRQGWATKTLEELKGCSIPENVTVVVQAGGARKWRNENVQQDGQRFVVEQGEVREVGTASEGSMGEATIFGDFLEFCQSDYPSDRTAVVLWDHGGGPLRGACFDENSSFDALTLAELDKALKRGVEARGGKTYDIVGFDACLMGSLETAVTLADDADWLVASEEIVSGAGWDYNPLVGAMGTEGADVAAISAAICDGYKEKCADRGKDATATCAAIDLSRVSGVEKALESVLDALKEHYGLSASSLRRLSYGARIAEEFGGAVADEGQSNLVDLKGLAQACSEAYGTDEVPWDELVAAVDQAVAHHVNGSTTVGAAGMSIWYPVSLEDSELKDYVKVSPLTTYASALNEFFSMDIGRVEFSDAGSIVDGKLSVTIDPKTASAFYDSYVVNRRVDGSYEDHNVDREDDWESLTFTWQPSYAVMVTLEGMPLDVRAVSYTDDYIVFSSPIRVNGKETFLRFAWVTDEENPEGGYYQMLGTWNGIDYVTGLADRFLDDLQLGDKVEAVALETGEARGSVTLEGDIELVDQPMEAGKYECWFVALDLFGNEYTSDVCTYTVGDGGTVVVDM